ncbi:hypothetical protein BJ508DRAFT_329081 [Ascobolus immersus RN42]|uniref:Uncharacterized protein n=1 Tax=Ascobolus immersus RN42 TaxID=1160509 RepID=A0A3N4IA27_ASCIM|nr:hypothetical protein BJ508DRAFT_329081 [Ascobolus immersus RN42]
MAKTKPSSEITINLTGAAALADKITLKRTTANTSYNGNSRTRTTQTESMSMIKNEDGTTSRKMRKTESMTITDGVSEPTKGGRKSAATAGTTNRVTATASTRGGGSRVIELDEPAPVKKQSYGGVSYGGVSKPAQPARRPQYNNSNSNRNSYNNNSQALVRASQEVVPSSYGRNNNRNGGQVYYTNNNGAVGFPRTEYNTGYSDTASFNRGGYGSISSHGGYFHEPIVARTGYAVAELENERGTDKYGRQAVYIDSDDDEDDDDQVIGYFEDEEDEDDQVIGYVEADEYYGNQGLGEDDDLDQPW